ncbi:MAG: EamA family transporter [Syntrophomonadaceae bacterium]|nr:EamA family transporter [Syntrophomonadaceae bacterium]
MKSIEYGFKDIALLQLSTFILSLGAIVAKQASGFKMFSVDFISYYLLEIFIIGVYAILWQQIIKKFEISVAYANKGTLIIWTMIWAVLFFQETVSINNVLGAALVIAGIIMVFKDDK